MYVVTEFGIIVSPERFPDKYSAEVWCLHNGYARLKHVNNQGDTIIKLIDCVKIEKIGWHL